jgi:23S rRNA pseudouridine1911/1915/1917 synthase
VKLNIVFEDMHLLVIYKPAGVPVQSAEVGREDCVSILKNYLYDTVGKEPYVGLIHRLDQPVEGILVFAKTPFAARELSRQVTDGTMEKYYLALGEEKSTGGKCGNTIHNVDNVDSLVDKSGILEDYLWKSGKTNTSQVVPAHTNGAKLAKLQYEVLGVQAGKKLLKIRLFTGRHHQIRVQMAYHGCPLAGDRKYGPQMVEEKNVDKPAKRDMGLALCAYGLKFIHPKTKKFVEFQVCPQHPVLREAYENFREDVSSTSHV